MAQSHNPQSYAQVAGGSQGQVQQQGSSQPSYDQLVQQVTALTNQLQALQQQPPPPPPVVQVISDKIKMPTPDKFDGKMDGDSVRAFVETIDNYFDLVQLNDSNLRARFVYSLLTGPAVDWFRANGFTLNRIHWPTLRQAMLAYFQPADWERVCLQKLQAVKQGERNVDKYINAFNIALNRCGDTVPDNIALHLFEQGLSSEIALQVYNARCPDLTSAQQVAQSAALALGMAGKQNNKPSKFIPPKGPKKPASAAHSGPGSGSGFKPMDLGTANGQRKCYNCGQPGHYAKQCPQPKKERKQGKNNNFQGVSLPQKPDSVDRLAALENSVATLVNVVATLAKNE